MENPVTVLPEPDSPTKAEHLTVADRKRYIVDRFDHAGAGKNACADCGPLTIVGFIVSRRGLSTSRNWFADQIDRHDRDQPERSPDKN